MTKIIAISHESMGSDIEICNAYHDGSIIGAEILILNDFHRDAYSSSERQKHFFNTKEHWLDQIEELTSEGVNVFVLIQPYKKLIYGSPYDLINLNYDFKCRTDTNIVLKHNAECFQKLYDNLEDNMVSRIYFTEKVPNPIFTTKTGKANLGWYEKHNNAYMVYLPKIINFNSYTVQSDFWNSVVEIDTYLKALHEPLIKPDWVDNDELLFSKEKANKEKISNNNIAIQTLNTENGGLEEEIGELEKYKALLYGTGDPLQNISDKAFQILGFETSTFEHPGENETDLILKSPEGERYVTEITGSKKCIPFSKLTQLNSNVGFDIKRHEEDADFIVPVGILLANPFKNIVPEERLQQGDNWAKHIIENADRMRAILIPTEELFKAVKYHIENPDSNYPEYFRNILPSFIGKVFKFSEPDTPIINDKESV